MLIDGHALVHRAFHALPGLTTTTGELTNAVYGWTTMTIKSIADVRPTHVIVAFDCAAPTFRHERYTEYKATRARTPAPLVPQFNRVRQVAGVLGLPIIEAPGFEADDVLGTLAKQAETQGIPTVIVTGDLDTLQLVTDQITILTSKRQLSETIIYDKARVLERYGLEPRQLIDLKGLLGDTSDNIPGVRGIGEKTAGKLLLDYDSLEGIYDHLDEIPARQAELLRVGREQAFESRILATIVDAPVDLHLDHPLFENVDMTALAALFRELEFHTLIPRVEELRAGREREPQHRPGDQQLSLFGESTPSEATPGPAPRISEVQTVTDRSSLEALAAALNAAEEFAIWVEAEGPHSVDSDLIGLGFATESGRAWYLPIGHADNGTIDPIEAVAAVAPALEDAGKRLLGYDLKRVHLVLGSHGVTLASLHTDVMLASYLESASGRLVTIESITASLLGIELPNRETLQGKGVKKVSCRDLSPVDVGEYAGTAADMVFRLSGLVRERLRHRELETLLDKLEMPLVPVLSDMERAGVSLDIDLLAEMSTDLAQTLEEIEVRVHEEVGHPFNINSPPQLGEVLFGEMKLKKGRKTKTGWSTDNEVLEKLRGEAPIVDAVLEYRQLMKLKGTYVDALPALISPRDGRLHTEFNQAVAATGRLSSSNPNLQNIPIRTEMGHRIRQAFIPASAGCLILAADYSQIELRVLAHLSEDSILLEAFRAGQDIHAVTAGAVWGIDPSEVSKDQRRIAKVVNFGIAYGIGSQRLAYETGLTREEADAFIARYRRTYAGLTEFMEGVRNHAHLYGQVSTLLGRVRNLPEIHSTHPGLRQAAERAAINMPIQGTAADIIKLAMVNIADELRRRSLRSTMILQVHDELVFEVPREELNEMAELVRDRMSTAVDLLVPLGVDVNVGPNWGQLERFAA
jgi:DNA polymerase-1